MNDFVIVEGVDVRRGDVVDVFCAAGEANGWSYPPASRIRDVGSVEGWVWLNGAAFRWDAISETDDGRRVVGSVQVELPDGSTPVGELERFSVIVDRVCDVIGFTGNNKTGLSVFDLGVIQRLVVHPAFRGMGCGEKLTDTALMFIRDAGKLPVLEVLESQTQALCLYEKFGGVVVGEFAGRSGNVVKQVVFTR